MIDKVKSYIEEHNMLSMGDRIVVGVSGGADSICLFHVLMKLSIEYDLTLFVVHVNHGIRGDQADFDEKFVEEVCKKYNVSYSCLKEDVPRIAREQGLGEEEVGRNVRYKAFTKFYKQYHCNKIAVAHNKNDNAETFLFNLFRGSGIRGLTGIPAKRGVIIRPLLGVERQEIESYLEEGNIPYVTDDTNLGSDYSRNKIRHHILKYAKDEINNSVIDHIASSTVMLGEINSFINKCVDHAFSKSVKEDKTKNEICIDIDCFNKLDIVIQKELIRKVIEKLSNNLKDISSSHVQSVLDLTYKQVGKEIHLPYDIIVLKGYDDLIFRKQSKSNKGLSNKTSINEGLEIPVPGNISLSTSKISLTTSLKKYRRGSIIPKERYTKWFDYDKIKNTLVIRNRQEGDFMQINSNGGTKKIKSLFIDEKIPREKRDQIPLIADGSHIVWILGGRISEGYKVDDNTKIRLEIKIYGGQ